MMAQTPPLLIAVETNKKIHVLGTKHGGRFPSQGRDVQEKALIDQKSLNER